MSGESYARDWPVLVRRAERVLGSRADAEDVVQNAFVAALALDAAQDVGRGWLHVVTQRQSADLIRGEQRRKALLIRCWTREIDVEEDVAVRVVSAHQARWLLRQLSRLPSGTQAVIAAVAEGLEVRDIAKALLMSDRAVEGHLDRARRFLRQHADGPQTGSARPPTPPARTLHMPPGSPRPGNGTR